MKIFWFCKGKKTITGNPLFGLLAIVLIIELSTADFAPFFACNFYFF
jgi:hypothetical protein